MRFAHLLINYGIFIGFCSGAMVLLRPVLCRVFTAQQRVVLWFGCVGYLYMLSNVKIIGQMHLPHFRLPVHLYDLITNQTWRDTVAYGNPYYVDLSNVPYLGTIYIVSLCLIAIWLIYRSFKPNQLKNLGVRIEKDDPWVKHIDTDYVNNIYVVNDLPTSFVDGNNNIYLQKLHSPQRMYQIFLHEANHVRLRHTYFKGIFTFLLVLYWWNPLIWLGFRYMVRDMELACDSAVLGQLRPEERTEYAKTLVELGCGRQLWSQPLCFGECDAQLRVREALKWKPQKTLQRVVRYALMIVVFWFFWG